MQLSQDISGISLATLEETIRQTRIKNEFEAIELQTKNLTGMKTPNGQGVIKAAKLCTYHRRFLVRFLTGIVSNRLTLRLNMTSGFSDKKEAGRTLNL